MGKFIDLTGQKFGRLTVISRAENRNQNVYWHCRCDCGAEKIIRGERLKCGETKSCGCLKRELEHQRSLNGISKTQFYYLWRNLIQHYCNEYFYYNGRRITLCREWYMDYQAFYDYISKLPHFGEEGYKFFYRIREDRDFEPNNVCWTKQKKTNNLPVEYNGEKMSMSQATKLSAIPYRTLLRRYRKGDRGRKLFRPTLKYKIYVEYGGEKLNLTDLAQKTGINLQTLKARYYRGDRGERLFRPIKRT